MGVYRASISGDILIIESMNELDSNDRYFVFESFGLLTIENTHVLKDHKQERGKIGAIDEKIRKKIILDLTLKHNIFSLGRFATWRNIVLDDVYNDILVIKRLINKGSYDHHLELTK